MPVYEASTLPIYTALNIPTVTSYPSLKCVQWSADGQVCFISKSAVIIMTPDHGINFDNGSVIKSTPSKDDPALGWFKTMIQHDKATPTRWPEYSQAWGAVSLGSIDLSVISMAISPVGVSSNGGCVFASLSSNMDVNLWTAGKNYLKGEWLKISDVNPLLLNYGAQPEEEEEKHEMSSVLKAQIVCLDWTPQADFGLSPTPFLDSSLLILGNRAGCLTFLRYRHDAGPEIIATLIVADKWVTQIAFSCWNRVQPGHCEGYLAYGLSDGSLGLVKVTQILREDVENFSFTPKYNVEVALDLGSSLINGPESKASITSLQWVHTLERSPILVSSNPGIIKLWSASDDVEASFWTGSRSLRLQTQKISADSSALLPVSGLSYLQKQDRLIVTLYDGSFHVIRNFSSDPEWAVRSMVDSGEDYLTSEVLSSASRATFVKAEKGNVDINDMVKVDGAISYDGGSCFLWVYETARPSDFSYKHDAKHSSTLIVAQMWDDDNDYLLLEDLATLLNTVKTASGLSPLHMLRPFLIHIRKPGKPDDLHLKFLEMLVTQSHEDSSNQIVVPTWDQELTDDIRHRFRISLTTNLFGWDDLLSLRMRLSLADFAWKLASSDKRQEKSGVIAQGLLNTISHRVLRTIIRHLLAVIELLTPNDIPFVSRMIVQSLLPGCPPDLAEEGRQLSVRIQPLIDSSTSNSGGADGVTTLLNESCPACQLEVPFHDITTAVCANGHTWARCSVTTFVLSTPWVRTCVGCSRKAFLPPSANKDLPKIAHGWVVEELLDAVHRCLFCNNGFVSVL